jgi:2-polyprenyl-6-methoxyphenol hydroxylase-like FAD-dependent oxidoreductase
VRIACLGGGPGSLLAALLAKRGDPGREVTVFERNRAGDTFGFGVMFWLIAAIDYNALDPAVKAWLRCPAAGADRVLDGRSRREPPSSVRRPDCPEFAARPVRRLSAG